MTATTTTAAQPKTLYAKLVDSHTVSRIDDNTVLLYCDIHFANEYTSPQAFSGVRERGLPVLTCIDTAAAFATAIAMEQKEIQLSYKKL